MALLRPSRLLCVSVFIVHCVLALKFSSVTDHVGLGHAQGDIAGFADFNADKATDVLLRTATGTFSMYLWSRDNERFRRHDIEIQNSSSVAYIVAVDLDADGQVDLLTLSQSEGNGGSCHTMAVHWLSPQRGGPAVDQHQIISHGVLSPVLVLDSNGDHIPDLMTHSCTSDPPLIWNSRGFLREFEPLSVASSLKYRTAYYVDITNDNLADVVVDGWSTGGGRSLALYQKKTSCGLQTSLLPLSLPVPLPLPLNTASVASPLAFGDMDGDGATEAVAFSCPDADCSIVQVHILSHEPAKSASSIDCTSNSSTHHINFTQVHTVSLHGLSISPSSLRDHSPVLGDVDLDGYPDITLPAASTSSGVLLLVARQCHTHCNGSHVTLEPQWLPVTIGNLTTVAFFDLWEDGVLDVLLTQQNDAPSNDQWPKEVLAFRQRLQDDHAFLKVLVLSGYCYHNCHSGQVPYGSTLPGAVVRFSTTDRMGRQKKSVRTLTLGHTHQLPFVVFGLGQTPSLVEKMEVGVEGGDRAASHTWTNLVPNSQVIVIPHPPDQPHKWLLELYLTPGALVYSTAGVLAALFLATAIIVLLLQAREKFQDTREKKMAKHKFHFNAM